MTSRTGRTRRPRSSTQTVSSTDQDLPRRRPARAARCQVIRAEKTGTRRDARTELDTLLQFLRSGDTLVVTRIDRLARSLKDLQDIVCELKCKGVTLKATEQPMDTSTAARKGFFDMLGVFAEFETNLRREQQMEGITAAKAPRLQGPQAADQSGRGGQTVQGGEAQPVCDRQKDEHRAIFSVQVPVDRKFSRVYNLIRRDEERFKPDLELFERGKLIHTQHDPSWATSTKRIGMNAHGQDWDDLACSSQ